MQIRIAEQIRTRPFGATLHRGFIRVQIRTGEPTPPNESADLVASLRNHKWRRVWASGSPILIGAVPLLISAVPIVSAISSDESSNTSKRLNSAAQNIFSTHAATSSLAVLAAIVGIALLALRWRSEYLRRTYDPTWTLHFSGIFESKDMKATRAAAAADLQLYAMNSAHAERWSGNVDDILDFFEDLGFYVQGDQMTPEVAHHTFYYWLRGYYLAAKPYIESKQTDRPGQWKWVRWLFEATYEAELESNLAKAKRSLGPTELEIFLTEEQLLLQQAAGQKP